MLSDDLKLSTPEQKAPVTGNRYIVNQARLVRYFDIQRDNDNARFIVRPWLVFVSWR